MTTTDHLHRLFRRIRRMTALQADILVADAELLDRFVKRRDEAAFELLVWRHEKMVLGVCQRVLQHAQDAQDAFQVTFLAFARKAASVAKRESIASWLYKVAYRAALAAKACRGRRAARERETQDLPELAAPEVEGSLSAWNEVRAILDEEVMCLPEKYRTLVVLFYLEGKAYEEVARQLSCPAGTVSSRLARARDLLRKRLVRRGVHLSAGLFSAVLAQHAAEAAVPVALVNTTIHAALMTASGIGNGAISARVAVLTEGVLKSMFATKVKTVLSLAFAVSLFSASAGLLAAVTWSDREDRIRTPPTSGTTTLADDGEKVDDGKPDPAADRKRSADNLKKLAGAMHEYHEVNDRFPPASLLTKDGKPLLSWRVLLLPYLEQKDLYKEFHLDEPWDSKHNKELLAKMPPVFAPVSSASKDTHATFYQVFVGKGTMFDDPKGVRIRDITDGTVNTAMLVEGAEAVPWTKPADLAYAADKALPKLGGVFKEGFHLATADGFVRFVKKDFDEKLMRAVITRAGGEKNIDPNDLKLDP
jgi:RNA polymerase sigma factor (sigma-70 family)